MLHCDLIICERTSRWASAVRLAVEREAATNVVRHRLRETRRVRELASELAERPASLVALEVREGNLGEVLAWLSAAERCFPQARFAALVDRALSAADQSVRLKGENSLREVCDALGEAGVALVVESPRRLGPLLELARCHARIAAAHEENIAENLPYREQVWATLPWQDR